MCRIWGALRAEQQATGHSIAPQDAWIAATALRHHLALITHNVDDYRSIATLELRTARP
jgi:tRNA(fMet)-specific endonuclease VapC